MTFSFNFFQNFHGPCKRHMTLLVINSKSRSSAQILFRSNIVELTLIHLIINFRSVSRMTVFIASINKKRYTVRMSRITFATASNAM